MNKFLARMGQIVVISAGSGFIAWVIVNGVDWVKDRGKVHSIVKVEKGVNDTTTWQTFTSVGDHCYEMEKEVPCALAESNGKIQLFTPMQVTGKEKLALLYSPIEKRWVLVAIPKGWGPK